MTPLTRKEIYTELKKLGITTTPELKSYLMEYYKYYVQPDKKAYSPQKSTAEEKDNQPNMSTSRYRFSLIGPFK
jgi:excinuclease UvrABC helicase subunit UvrB